MSDPPTATQKPALRTRGLSKRWGAFDANSEISLAFAPGARHALIGPNGAGKTTFINLLTGVFPPTAGEVFLGDDNITALSQHEVETEVDRYISWPGQADSYMLGELTIRKLRSEAEQELGPKFDIRGFHDTFLGMGAVPLTVLEQQMREWIRKQKAKA